MHNRNYSRGSQLLYLEDYFSSGHPGSSVRQASSRYLTASEVTECKYLTSLLSSQCLMTGFAVLSCNAANTYAEPGSNYGSVG